MTSYSALAAVLKPLTHRARTFVVCAALVLATTLALPAAPAKATTFPTAAQYRASLLAYVNAERTKRGIPALHYSGCAQNSYAVPWAFHMAYYRSMTHQSMSKLLVGCNASVAAENIGAGAVSAKSMVAMWMASAPHRANILSTQLHYIGVGAAHVRSLTWYTVLDFTAA
jgi:uncharacterized protein YkwD